jgi:hypothetical protein
VNDNDPIDGWAGFKELQTRLGKKLDTLISGNVTLAPNALYVDFSKTGVDHRYFIASGQKGNPYVKDFFRAVLSGDPFKFDGYGGVDKVEQRDGTKIYYIK